MNTIVRKKTNNTQKKTYTHRHTHTDTHTHTQVSTVYKDTSAVEIGSNETRG